MKRSKVIPGGNYIYYFNDDDITVKRVEDPEFWEDIKNVTYNWVTIEEVTQSLFYFEGNDNTDIRVVPIEFRQQV